MTTSRQRAAKGNLSARKVPSDDEIHARFYEMSGDGLLTIIEEDLAEEWEVNVRTVREAVSRLVDQGRVVRTTLTNAGLAVVDPEAWPKFRAEAAARSDILDRVHQQLWTLARKSRTAWNRVRVKRNRSLYAYIGQTVVEELIAQERLSPVGEDRLAVASPLSFIAERDGELTNRDGLHTIEVEPRPIEDRGVTPVPIEPSRKETARGHES